MKGTARILDSMPFFLLLLIAAAFGGLIPWLGFYWDDWPSIWFLHFLGPNGFARVFAGDRPLLGILFQLTTPLLGEQPFAWQIFGLLTHWLAAISFWWMLWNVFPMRPRLAATAAVLFAVYPGFSQQFISVTYSHVFILQAMFFLSMSWMVQAVAGKSRRWLRYGLSLLTGGIALFSVEYFFGLELLRPFLIWITQKERSAKTRLLRTIAYWAPYLGLGAGFLFWRIALTKTPRGDVTLLEDLAIQPSATIFDLLFRNVFPDVFESGLLAWVQGLHQALVSQATRAFLPISLTLAVVISILIWFWMRRYHRISPAEPRDRAPVPLIALGTLALFAGGWPFWATNLPIELRFPWDRFTLAMMPGASLLATGLILLLNRWRRLQSTFFHLLIVLAVASHLQSANIFRQDWNLLKDFLWQLAWRAPAIEPRTLLITSELPFSYFSDNSLTAPINWMYSPAAIGNPMPYALSDLETRFGRRIQSFESDQDYKQNYRVYTFYGNTSQALVFYFSPPACLKLLVTNRDERLPQQPRYLSDAMRLSRAELVQPAPSNPAQPPPFIIGKEPEASWCTFFEKAELAVQLNNWTEAAQMANQALSLNYRLYESQAPELIPFIEAYAHTGHWDLALDLTQQALGLSSRMKRSLCDTWNRVQIETQDTSDRQTSLLKLGDMLTCK